MQTNTASITRLLGQLHEAASASGWATILEDLDLHAAIGSGTVRDAVQLRRAMETERSVRRFGAETASHASIFEVRPCVSGASRPCSSHLRPSEAMEALASKTLHRAHESSETARLERRLLLASAERTQLAVVLLNPQGEVIEMTRHARTLLAEADGLALRSKKLRTTTNLEQSEFSALLTEAARPEMDRGDSAAEGAMLLTRRAPRRPLQVVVAPVRTADRHEPAPGSVMVFLCDPQATPAPRAPILRRLYGLSPTEGRLADELAAGTELQEAALHLRLSIHTARFHLKSIFRKMSVNRQSDLVRVVLGLPGARDGDLARE